MLFILGLFSQPLIAQEAKKEDVKQKDYSNEPWERGALYLGPFSLTPTLTCNWEQAGRRLRSMRKRFWDWMKISRCFGRRPLAHHPPQPR